MSESTDEPGPVAADLAEKVMENAGYSRERLQEEIEKKKAEYDMLTDEGALTLVANELGIGLDEMSELPTMRIAQLKPGMQELDVVGRVVGIRQPRQFTRRDGSPGYVCSLILSDRTGSVRVTLWDQECRLLEEVKEQDIIKVIGGVCRSGPRGHEIHRARRARFVLNPKVSEDPRVADLDSVVEPVEAAPVRKRISDLDDGDINIEVRATIVRFYRVWTYDACPTCGRKAVDLRCPVCGSVDPVPRAITDIGIDDSSGFIRAKFFGELAETLLDLPAADIRRGVDALVEMGMDPRRASEEYLNREHLDILGSEAVLRGRAALDEYRGLVMSVNGIREPDPVEETRRVLEEVGL
jgi:replication factor A1